MAEGKEEEEKKEGKKGKLKRAFDYGNYPHYYGYRIGRNQKEDPRLVALKREWFEGKDCLDVGCNQGLITIDIAKRFCCRSILGIDIDADLIEVARRRLRKIARVQEGKGRSMDASQLKVSENLNGMEHGASQASNGKMINSQSDASTSIAGNLFERVSFRSENFVASLRGCSEKYDTILCLSVTKWIHLNWGDDGLITLFVKMWRLLRPGGVLILEPQPWSSYERNRLVSETSKANYNNIQILPDDFREVLLDKVGFRSAMVITRSLSGTVVGFDRPILVFHK